MASLRNFLPLALLAAALPGTICAQEGGEAATASRRLDFAVGADLSFLSLAEQSGVVLKDNGVAKPGLELFREKGYGWVRLRLFHSPDRLPNDLAYTIDTARRAKALGYKFLLDLHYSDTWADPAKQLVPAAWRELTHEQLVAAVRNYTRDTLAAFAEADAAPDMVQVGNEVISGMLWPDGKLPQCWPQFAELLKAGIAGVHDAEPDDPPLIMVHIDRGGDVEGTRYFFDKCRRYNVEFDVIGQSYYPWWHGGLDDLRANLEFMATEYRKDIVLVEVAYNWRKAEYPKGDGPFPETPAGQRRFLEEVASLVRATPDGRGKGVFWWEPAVVPGPIYSRGLFNDEGEALPALEVFEHPSVTLRP